MKHILFSILLLATSCARAQMTDHEARVLILEQALFNLNEGNVEGYRLWYPWLDKLNEENLAERLQSVLPATLQMHVDRHSALEGAARKIQKQIDEGLFRKRKINTKKT